MGFTALIAGGLGAAGSIGSALIGSNAASNAAAQQAAMQQQALAIQQQQFQTGENAVNPFISAGQSVLPTLQNLLTPGTAASTLSQMPGFQFASQYGSMAAQNALAGKTGASAGPLAAAISQYNNGLASSQYNSTVGNLQNFANLGAGSANALMTGAINSGNSQASTLGSIGNAQASGTLGSASALSGGLSGLTSNAANASLLYGASQNGLYGPSQIAKIGNMDASQVSDAQANAFGQAMGFT